MASELQLAYGTTGSTLYAVVRNATGSVWNTAGAAFEAYSGANWTDYDVALTEQGSSGYYAGTFPAGITSAGVYPVEVRLRAGGSPAVTDTVVGTGVVEWDGSAVVRPFAGGSSLSELASVPGTTPTPEQALMLLYMALRNKLTVTATAKTVFNNAGTSIASKVLTDDGTTYTEAKMT